MKSILFIFSLCFSTNYFSLVIPLKRKFAEEIDKVNHKTLLTQLHSNFLSAEICLGTPPQCLSLIVKFSSYPLWVISSGSQSIKLPKRGFSPEKSISFFHKDSSAFLFSFDEFQVAYLVYDNLSINSPKFEFKELFFLVAKSFEKLPLGDGVLGLQFVTAGNSISQGSNLVYQLRKKKLISSYTFSILYDDEYPLGGFQSARLLIGESPDAYVPSLKGKKLVFHNTRNEDNQRLRWGYIFDSVESYGESVGEKVNVRFSVEDGFILGTEEYFQVVHQKFFKPLEEKDQCSKVLYSEDYLALYCKDTVDISTLDDLVFTKDDLKISFTYKDLFLHHNNQFIFLVNFPVRNNLFQFFEWRFGAPFFKKEHVVFDIEKKMFGIYVDKESDETSGNKQYFVLLNVLLVIFIICLLLACFIVYKKERISFQKKKMKNYMMEEEITKNTKASDDLL